MIQEILPSQLFVPKPYNQLLQGLRRPAAEHEKSSDTPPRYAVTVSWGTDYLPWVREVRLLPQAAGGGTP
jgi:hypothetical protein